MPKSISWRKLVQKFRRLGFDGPYAGGRHLFMKHADMKVIIPNPHSRDISGHLVAEILEQAGITDEEWSSV